MGNPFDVRAYIDGDFYVMNSNGTNLEAAQRNYVEPMEGIIVVTDADGTLTFSKTKPADKNASLALNVSSGRSIIDRAIVRFGENRNMRKVQLFDNSTMVYIPQFGTDYAVVSADDMGEMPVNFQAEKNGTYTLSINAENVTFGYLHLIDNMTGDDIDLLETQSYTFNARKDDYASRFKLVFATGNNNSESFGFVSNGNIVLEGISANTTVQVIDALGRILFSNTGVNTVSTDGMASGVYVLRLINGDNTKTQKIVIK